MNFRDLTVYKKSFSLAMEAFEITKGFPSVERFELTDQIRRCTRGVCRAIGKGYRKRQYPQYFASKMSDADMENTETQISFDFAEACGYISKEKNLELRRKSEEIGRLLNHMINNPEKYQRKTNREQDS